MGTERLFKHFDTSVTLIQVFKFFEKVVPCCVFNLMFIRTQNSIKKKNLHIGDDDSIDVRR